MPDPHAINIYTDGSVRFSPRRSGLGFVIELPEEAGGLVIQESNPGYRGGTISQVELMACIKALNIIQRMGNVKNISRIIINTDSLYVKENYPRAMFEWPQNGWKNHNNKPIRHAELWRDLRKLIKKIQKRVDVEKVKAHSGNPHNTTANILAKQSSLAPGERIGPLVIRKKITTKKTKAGSVQIQNQKLTVRIIDSEYDKVQKMSYCRYEVISKGSRFFGCADFAWNTFFLRAGHMYCVRMGSICGAPAIVTKYFEIKKEDTKAK